MSNYRRLISYIYAYEGGVKGKNIGFAKIEIRNGQCRIHVNVKRIFLGNSDIGVYLLAPQKEILLGRIFIRNGTGEFRVNVNAGDVENSGCSMEQCYGLTIHETESTWRTYTTIWEDAVTQAAEVDLANVTADKVKNQTTAPAENVASVSEEIQKNLEWEEGQGEGVLQEEKRNRERKEEAVSGMEAETGSRTGAEAIQTEAPEMIQNNGNSAENMSEKSAQREAESRVSGDGVPWEQPLETEGKENYVDSDSREEQQKESQEIRHNNPQLYYENPEPQGDFLPKQPEAEPLAEKQPVGEEPMERQPTENPPMAGESPKKHFPEEQSPEEQPQEQPLIEHFPQTEGKEEADPEGWKQVHPMSSITGTQMPENAFWQGGRDSVSEKVLRIARAFVQGKGQGTEHRGIFHQGTEPGFENVGNPEGIPGQPISVQPVAPEERGPMTSPQKAPMFSPGGGPMASSRKHTPSSPGKTPAASPPEPGDPARLAELDRQEQEEQEQGSVWKLMQRRYPKVLAFDYANGCEILSIKPQDIGILPRENWVYGNNSFLLHGYYNYRHLILAKLENPGGEPRYLLGVPGHYYSNEKHLASMFGFPNFVLAKKQPEQDGRFGYWYTDLRL